MDIAYSSAAWYQIKRLIKHHTADNHHQCSRAVNKSKLRASSRRVNDPVVLVLSRRKGEGKEARRQVDFSS